MNAIQWDPSDDALMDVQEALRAARSVPPRVVEAEVRLRLAVDRRGARGC